MADMTRWIWGGVALWVAVVLIGSGLAWIAIDRAGQQVSSSVQSGPSGPSVPDAAAPVSGTGSTARPTGAPTATPTATVSSRPTTSATARPGNSPTRTPSESTPSAAPDRPTPAADRPRVRTWTGAAGSLTVSCTGLRGEYISASPADGWRVERRDSGSRIRVTFERNESEVEVEARCASSGPVFDVDTRAEDENESED